MGKTDDGEAVVLVVCDAVGQTKDQGFSSFGKYLRHDQSQKCLIKPSAGSFNSTPLSEYVSYGDCTVYGSWEVRYGYGDMQKADPKYVELTAMHWADA